MAMTADSSSSSSANQHSPSRKNLSSPWAQVVRGEPEVLEPLNQSPPSSPDQKPSNSPLLADSEVVKGTESNVGSGLGSIKKPAWSSRKVNDAVEAGPVMGDPVSWPALGESARASPKAVESNSGPRSPAEGLGSASQGSSVAHTPQKQATGNTTNHSHSPRQRNKRNGGGGSSSGVSHLQGRFNHPHPHPLPPPPPPLPIFQMPPHVYGNFIMPVPDPSMAMRDPPYKGNNWDGRPMGRILSQSHPISEHRGPSRRGGSGPHPRRDGPNNSHGNRRDQDPGNFTGGRDASQRASPRGYVRPAPSPPSSPPFIAPPHLGPFVTPVGFSDMTPQYYFPQMPMESYRGGPFISHAPPPQAILPPVEHAVPVLLQRQIDYYFSDDNLVKDEFLKSKMNNEGWVSIDLIAGFPRVKSLANDINIILDSLKTSSIVEVQGNNVRRRNDWMKWICAPGQIYDVSGSLSPGGSTDDLVSSFQDMKVKDTDADESASGKEALHQDVVSNDLSHATGQL